MIKTQSKHLLLSLTPNLTPTLTLSGRDTLNPFSGLDIIQFKVEEGGRGEVVALRLIHTAVAVGPLEDVSAIPSLLHPPIHLEVV